MIGENIPWTAASAPGSACPPWCNDHIGDLHQRLLGGTDAQLQVVLEQHDPDGVPGRPQVSFRFCADGRLIDDSTEFPVEMILEALRAGR